MLNPYKYPSKGANVYLITIGKSIFQKAILTFKLDLRIQYLMHRFNYLCTYTQGSGLSMHFHHPLFPHPWGFLMNYSFDDFMLPPFAFQTFRLPDFELSNVFREVQLGILLNSIT